MKDTNTPTAVRQFDDLPDTALTSIANAGLILDRSRASIYRHIDAGELTIVRVGKSTRLSVGEVRKLARGAVSK